MRILNSRDTFPAHVSAQKIGQVKIQSADSVCFILILLKDLTMASSDDDCIVDFPNAWVAGHRLSQFMLLLCGQAWRLLGALPCLVTKLSSEFRIAAVVHYTN
jgi:hypothetical protein